MSSAACSRLDLPTSATAARETELDSLCDLVGGLLPWVSKSSGKPVGMWVEDAGRVDNRFEPHPPGTPYVWVAAASWDAAQAVYEALAHVARLDDAHWVGGWEEFASGERRIKIYPVLPLLPSHGESRVRVTTRRTRPATSNMRLGPSE